MAKPTQQKTMPRSANKKIMEADIRPGDAVDPKTNRLRKEMTQKDRLRQVNRKKRKTRKSARG